MGADRKLADWTEITGYLAELANGSERVRIDTLGRTTLGRPFVVLTISDSPNLASLERIRETQLQLADPRRIRDPEHLEELNEILANTVVLLIPSLNPDGVDKVVAWYRSSLGTEWEGASPPFLYHHYIGHDNNRDWYAFTQLETQLTVDQVHNAWHPQIVHDIHQQGRYGSRFFVPPWIDPIEPNVDPMLVASGNALGSEIAWSLLREGKKGIVLNATYDAWTPARAYQHYHAGVRILTETASAKLATPVEVDPDELEVGRGFDPRERSWNFPVPWEGGSWHLADIVDYMEAGAFALLRHAARNREAWLRNFVGIGERAVAGWPSWPAAWIVPPAVGDGANGPWPAIGVARLIRVLRMGDVEVGRALEPFDAAGRRFPAGSYIVEMRQPYAAFAQTLLEVQRYPDRRAYEGGPLLKPYDVTAHTLPLLFGVEAVPVEEPLEVERGGPRGAGLSRAAL
ncbi:MAG: M14 family zinc carboxypeptidase [Gemmatimonadales bacterium]